MVMIRVGHGYDSHRYKKREYIKLGGIKVSSNYATVAHSDGDVLLHALCDALLGASGNGDMGVYFDNSEKYKDMDSIFFLKKIMQIIQDDGYSIVNIDATIIAEKPRISAYAKKIEKSLSEILDINISSVNIKSKSNDFMGYIGRNEGIKAHVSLLIEKK